MDHAEAHERIADLALEAGRLAELASDDAPEAQELMAHVAACAACRDDLEAWRRTQAALQLTMDAGQSLGALEDENADPAEAPPATLRAAVARLADTTPSQASPSAAVAAPVASAGTEAPVAARGPGTATAPPGSATARRPKTWLSAAAAIAAVVLIVALAGLAADQARRTEQADSQASALAALASRLERVLMAPDHTAIALVDLDGLPAGTAAWSAETIVVVSTALAPPGDGFEYRCWIERDGQRMGIGVMRFHGDLAAWAGPLARYDDLVLDDGGLLGVSLETVGQPGGAPPELVGQLPD